MKKEKKIKAINLIIKQSNNELGEEYRLTPHNYYKNFYNLLKAIIDRDTNLKECQETLDLIIESFYFIEKKIKKDNEILDTFKSIAPLAYGMEKKLDISYWLFNVVNILDLANNKLGNVSLIKIDTSLMDRKLKEINNLIDIKFFYNADSTLPDDNTDDNTEKYKLIKSKAKNPNGGHLYRIRALKTFHVQGATVWKDDGGGYVESEANLSQEGNCWIFDHAKAYENSRVSDDAILTKRAIVRGDSVVNKKASVKDCANVGGKSIVTDEAQICDNVIVFNYKVTGKDKLTGRKVFTI